MWSLVRSLPLWGRSPSYGAHGAAACGAALALLALSWSCRRARGGVALGRRSSAAAARSLDARRLALSACGRQRGRITFCDVCSSPATFPERVLSVVTSCSLRELPRLRARSARNDLRFLREQPEQPEQNDNESAENGRISRVTCSDQRI